MWRFPGRLAIILEDGIVQGVLLFRLKGAWTLPGPIWSRLKRP